MATKAGYHFLLLVLLCSTSSNEARQIPSSLTPQEEIPLWLATGEKCDLTGFKKDFLFGAATSAYQVEGAKGRGLNIWDGFTHRYPEKTPGGSDGDVTINSYDFYKDDVAMMKDMGLNAYRFSISWSRVLPGGKLRREVNKKGIQYYNNLINKLKNANIEPFVTLFHWDLPQTLEDEYGGFLSPSIVDDFRDFADLCFREFGDRVKYWITLNQPYSYSYKGYADGTYPPVRCSKPNCVGGNSATEPYLVAHHQLLAHAEAVNLYRARYQAIQKGKIGTTLITRWFLPYSSKPEDELATKRAFDFMVGWFLDPMIHGDYPSIMKEIVGDRLPKFSTYEADRMKGSLDFVGLNYYFTQYVQNSPNQDTKNPSRVTDPQLKLTFNNSEGKYIGPKSCEFHYYPPGLLKMLLHVKANYQNPLVYLTENGFCDAAALSIEETLHDKGRVEFHKAHFDYLLEATKQGCNVGGYFAWSLLDNYEFLSGYTVRFGLNYVNYKNVTDRKPKYSAKWLKNCLNQR